MTQDEIIEMAKQAGLLDMEYEIGQWEIHEFTTFAKLVAAKEREACAKLVESFQRDHIYTADLAGAIGAIKHKLADAIRARGEA